jgi:hypothetical protein
VPSIFQPGSQPARTISTSGRTTFKSR